jgi:galactose-6-phosphate isomerase
LGTIDVTDLLCDPDFVDRMVLIHRTPTVSAAGENSLAESSEKTWGSVQPISGKTLQRLPDGLRVANVKSFWIKGVIVADAKGKYSDVIVSRGVRYNVTFVFDWTNWGSGWSEGTCVQVKPSL